MPRVRVRVGMPSTEAKLATMAFAQVPGLLAVRVKSTQVTKGMVWP